MYYILYMIIFCIFSKLCIISYYILCIILRMLMTLEPFPLRWGLRNMKAAAVTCFQQKCWSKTANQTLTVRFIKIHFYFICQIHKYMPDSNLSCNSDLKIDMKRGMISWKDDQLVQHAFLQQCPHVSAMIKGDLSSLLASSQQCFVSR